MQHHHANLTIFGASTGAGVWTLAAELLRHGPSWESLPPLVLSVVALVGAVNSYLHGAQERRHREAEHRAKLGCVRNCVPPDSMRLN